LIRVFILFCCVLSMTACASTPRKTPQQLKQENKAVVLGVERSVLRDVLAVLKGLVLQTGLDGEQTHLNFIAINGQSCSMWGWKDCQPHSVELPPGNYSLDFECAGRVYTARFRHTVPDYKIHVEPGHIYQMRADGSQSGCQVNHQDITPGIPKEQFHSEINPLYWKLGYQLEYFSGYYMDFVPLGKTTENWSKLIKLQFTSGHQLTEFAMIDIPDTPPNQKCPRNELTILELGEGSVTYLYNLHACMEQNTLSGIGRIYTCKDGLYKMTYTEKTNVLSEATIKEYLDLFDRSGVVTEENPE
jgi:hypothetical protein